MAKSDEELPAVEPGAEPELHHEFADDESEPRPWPKDQDWLKTTSLLGARKIPREDIDTQ